jgi:N-acyl-D-amino-acid deacylase
MSNYDLIIRDGLVFDGTAGTPYEADIAIKAGRIAAIERNIAGDAVEEIAAAGLIVTPGFVDIHTHYDGQAIWENRMAPSSNHGVTTVVAGNCGVGFAPCRPADHNELVRLLEGVEDIPEIVMVNGLTWNWETFPEYLEALAVRNFDVDIAVHIPHSALRVYVMGKRGVDREPATPEDIARMRELVAEAVRAGALGVSTSRNLQHRTKAGEQAPSIHSAEDELMGLAAGLRDAGRGVFQMIPNFEADPELEFDMMERLVACSGQPLSFTLLQTEGEKSYAWRTYLRRLAERDPVAPPIRGQVFPRPVGVLQGLNLSFHPFSLNPSFKKIAHLPLKEKVKAMRDPAIKAKLLSEKPESGNPFELNLVRAMPKLYRMGALPDYSPAPERSLAAQAKARGVSLEEMAYEMLLEDDGEAILYYPGANFIDGNLNAVHQMLTNPHTVMGLGDGGAHYGVICDSSLTTYLLTWWARDAPDDQRIGLAQAISDLTRTPALTAGFNDRGILAAGARADINVIDHKTMKLYNPRPVFDLPAGGRRLMQKADGYIATIVNGSVTYRNGLATDALPGRLQRGTAIGEDRLIGRLEPAS